MLKHQKIILYALKCSEDHIDVYIAEAHHIVEKQTSCSNIERQRTVVLRDNMFPNRENKMV